MTTKEEAVSSARSNNPKEDTKIQGDGPRRTSDKKLRGDGPSSRGESLDAPKRH